MKKKVIPKMVGGRYAEMKAPTMTRNGKPVGGVYRDLSLQIEAQKSKLREIGRKALKAAKQRQAEDAARSPSENTAGMMNPTDPPTVEPDV